MFDLHVQAISLLPTVKRLLKMMGYVLAGILLLVVIIVSIFVNMSPQMGGKHSKADQLSYLESGYYENGKFINLVWTFCFFPAP